MVGVRADGHVDVGAGELIHEVSGNIEDLDLRIQRAAARSGTLRSRWKLRAGLGKA